jgi:hypothetical protein
MKRQKDNEKHHKPDIVPQREVESLAEGAHAVWPC